VFAVPAYGPQNDVTLKMPAFEWVHVQLHQQKGMISLSPPTICNSANKGEARNSLARAVFFNRLGEIRDRSFEQQRYRASGLNLVTAAIVLWNTVYLERATQGLVEAGKPVDGELLQFLSPLGWEHINLTGDYVWRQSRRLEDGKFRPLRMPGKP
ncbi:TPA: Tn3 family transposase, partial [Escherichia coli]